MNLSNVKKLAYLTIYPSFYLRLHRGNDFMTKPHEKSNEPRCYYYYYYLKYARANCWSRINIYGILRQVIIHREVCRKRHAMWVNINLDPLKYDRSYFQLEQFLYRDTISPISRLAI